jgi:hypothetical protein
MAENADCQMAMTETAIGNPEVVKPIDPVAVQTAIQKLVTHNFHERMRRVDGHEPHRILPEIWPVINELCLIADACQAGMIEVKS